MTGPLLSPLLSWLLWGGLLVVGALALRSMATRGWYCRLGHCHRTALAKELCDAEHYEPRRPAWLDTASRWTDDEEDPR